MRCKTLASGMDADRDEPQGVFCIRAVAIDKEDNAADCPGPRSDRLQMAKAVCHDGVAIAKR